MNWGDYKKGKEVEFLFSMYRRIMEARNIREVRYNWERRLGMIP